MIDRALLRFGTTALLGATLLAPATAAANEYEIFIAIEDEEDLYDLQVTGEIGDGTFEVLVDLIRRGIDLNVATREQLYVLPNLTYDDVDAILAYREEAGRVGDPAALVIAGVLPRRKLEAIAPFLIVPKPEGSAAAVRGQVRYQTIWTAEDDRAPPMALQARVSTLRHLTVGATALLDRNRLDDVSWDPNRDALSSTGPRTTARVPKFFAQWDTPEWGVIAGTYTIGFGQRLVFDTTGRYTPNGFRLDDTVFRSTYLTTGCRETRGELVDGPCDDDADRVYVTPDFYARERQRGVAIGAKHIKMPEGWMQTYGFFSHQTRPVYQYGIYNRDICSDPRLNTALFPECSAPDVYVQNPDLLTPSTSFRFATLPNMFNEIQGGGNISYFLNRRTHVGATAYASSVSWLVDGADLDFQEWQRTPYGGPFGAAGADASWGRKWADVFAEVAYSFDSIDQNGGGGPAAVIRHTATFDGHEIEASYRYYDRKYQNPYARSIASADQTNGLRATDETGGRIRYTGHIAERVDLRTFFDVWHELSTGRTKLRTYARGDVQALDWLRPGLWVDYETRDITGSGRERCFQNFGGEEEFAEIQIQQNDQLSPESGSFDINAQNFGIDNGGCSGVRYRVTPRVRVDPHKRVSASAQFQYALLDDLRYDGRMRSDARVVGIVRANPVDPLRVTFRITWDKDDLSDDTYLNETLWGYVRVQYKLANWFQPSLRYDLRAWLDDRESTAVRRPNPEHWVLFQLTSRF
ncbi:MAG: hypothetical protein AAGA54_14995 [Myxococcota bacterium]